MFTPVFTASFQTVSKAKRTPEEQMVWASTPESKLAMKNYRSYTVIIAEDGSFRAEEVSAGQSMIRNDGQ